MIIGGSLAGAACVRELERLGIDAVAFDRDRFPRDKVCGGFLSPGAVACLEQLGLLSSVRAAGGVEVRSARVRVDETEVEIPFDRPGFGISRSALDRICAAGARVELGRSVTKVTRTDRGFLVDGVECSVVIDAAGKLSRFTPRRVVDEFGIQYTQAGARGDVLDFWFSEDGYGGAVSVEGGRSNFCFLIKKDRLPRYLGRPDCLVTGPLAYDRIPSEYIAIGDAAGMVDPFCGEGMRHALDSGMLAAHAVAHGLRSGVSYERMKSAYDGEWRRRWNTKRLVGSAVRRMLQHRRFFRKALGMTPARIWSRLWRS